MHVTALIRRLACYTSPVSVNFLYPEKLVVQEEGEANSQKGKSTQVLNIKKYNSVKDVTGKYQMTYSERGNGCKC